jgi:hypothetical protein
MRWSEKEERVAVAPLKEGQEGLTGGEEDMTRADRHGVVVESEEGETKGQEGVRELGRGVGGEGREGEGEEEEEEREEWGGEGGGRGKEERGSQEGRKVGEGEGEREEKEEIKEGGAQDGREDGGGEASALAEAEGREGDNVLAEVEQQGDIGVGGARTREVASGLNFDAGCLIMDLEVTAAKEAASVAVAAGERDSEGAPGIDVEGRLMDKKEEKEINTFLLFPPSEYSRSPSERTTRQPGPLPSLPPSFPPSLPPSPTALSVPPPYVPPVRPASPAVSAKEEEVPWWTLGGLLDFMVEGK